ncbi:hypothetical protein GGH94_000296 [Coemansia aciculifera]|uniref:Uncharacterized protein n=1 Tax=Coemansia aciculifera TaxID=417176 RepID=A0A9W8IWA0_9FUNG|nr:hypothetical protein GGH94_000296 [Coemansia aciculifera]KAJ2877065.1 hypothetical protein GGH93_000223 [Coemansia aciculifera]
MSNATTDGHPIPSREERQLCHSKRDLYFECLNKNNIIDAEKEGSGGCEELRKTMYSTCPESWATYFIQLRTMRRRQEIQKEKIAERMRNKKDQ